MESLVLLNLIVKLLKVRDFKLTASCWDICMFLSKVCVPLPKIRRDLRNAPKNFVENFFSIIEHFDKDGSGISQIRFLLSFLKFNSTKTFHHLPLKNIHIKQIKPSKQDHTSIKMIHTINECKILNYTPRWIFFLDVWIFFRKLNVVSAKWQSLVIMSIKFCHIDNYICSYFWIRWNWDEREGFWKSLMSLVLFWDPLSRLFEFWNVI